MIEGALPSTPEEVALAPATAEAIGVDVGDRFDLTGAASTANLLVTGLAFVPEGSHNEYDGGAWLTGDGFDRVIGGFKYHLADVTVRDGADPEAVKARIDRRGRRRARPAGGHRGRDAAPPAGADRGAQAAPPPAAGPRGVPGAAGGDRRRTCGGHRRATAPPRPRGAPGRRASRAGRRARSP